MGLDQELARMNNGKSLRARQGEDMFDLINERWRRVKFLFGDDTPKQMSLEEFLQGVAEPKITPYAELTPDLKAKADALRVKFPQWNNWGYYLAGNIKNVFVAQPVFDASSIPIRFAVKMDKSEKEILSTAPSQAMLQHYRKAYNARREANIALNTAGLSGFASPIEGRDLSDVGFPRCYAYAEQFVPSVSLQQLLEQKATFPKIIATHYARKMFEQCEGFFSRTGQLHRDLKPSNLLVALGERAGDLVITDTSAAGRPSEARDEFTHSCPGRKTCDPRLMSQRTGLSSKYDEASEVYSLTKIFGMMLLGEDFLPVSPYDKNPFNEGEYTSQLTKALDQIPNESRQYRSLLYAGLRYDKRRISTLKGLVKKLEEIERPTVWQKVKQNGIRNSLIALTGLSVLGIGANTVWKNYAELHKTKLVLKEEQRTLIVDADWNGQGKLQPSALFDMQVQVSGRGQRYPRSTSALQLQPGESATVFVDIVQKPLPSKDLNLPYLVHPIKVSIEGATNIPSMKFNTTAKNPKSVPPRNYPMFGGYPQSTFLEIPTNFPSGNYTIVVDAMPPFEVNSRNTNEFILDYNGTNVLAEERIPLVIGEPKKETICVGTMQFSYSDNNIEYAALTYTNGGFSQKEHSSLDALIADYHIPELNYSQIDWPHLSHIPLPIDKNIPTGSYTLIIDIRDKGTGKIELSTAYPLAYGSFKGYNLKDWNLARPSQDFKEKVEIYRAQIESSKQQTGKGTNGLIKVTNTGK